MQLSLQKNIENTILENYFEYQYLFLEFQSKFLTSLHTRYQGLENGNLVLFFAKQTHQDILRQKDYNLNFNISYGKFWENHHGIKPKKKSLIHIAKNTLLPKETARRKILQLIKQKVLNKDNRHIGWLPNEQYKQSYNLVVNKEIDDVCKLISFICKKTNISISKEELVEEIKEKFSFYWFHFLEVELGYLRLWGKQLKDLELILILLQVSYLFVSKAKEKNISHKDVYDNPSLIKDFIGASISATSIAEVTGIPRATCVRKLDNLVKIKIIMQDKHSKRYYIIPNAVSDDLLSRKITEKIVKLFSNFFFICIRAIDSKT
ncbi:hypothetical protein N8726_00390 [Pelagibacteraceae bacterium]|nr:hypothetical protein [Pelagibacteraceae bacterium]